MSENNSTEKKNIDTQKKVVTLKQPKAFVLAILILVVFGAVVWAQKHPKGSEQVADAPAASVTPQASQTDEEYLNQMIPLHQEAVDASRYLVENSENDILKKFAQNVIEKRSKEVWTLLGFYQLWLGKSYAGSPRYIKLMPELTQLSGEELDKAYVRGMMAHHQSSVKLTQSVLQTTNINEMKTFGAAVINDQLDQLKQLNEWSKQYQ